MIQNRRQTFPFSRAPSTAELKRERTELENVTKFLQDELDVLRNELNTLLEASSEENQAAISELIIRVSNLETQVASLFAFIELIDELISLSTFGYVLHNPSDPTWSTTATIPWADISGVPSFVEAAWLSQVAFTGRYKDLRGTPNIIDRAELAKVAFTGQYSHLKHKPLLVGDTMYQYDNFR